MMTRFACTTAFTVLAAALAGCRQVAAPDASDDGPSVVSEAAAVAAGWQEAVIDAQGPSMPWGKAMGDINGDGLPDLLLGDASGRIYWYRAPDWQRFQLSSVGGGDDLAVGDIDMDGDLDVISNGGGIWWSENPSAGGGNPTAAWKYHAIDWQASHDLLVGDIDRDGKTDVGVRHNHGSTTLFLQRGPDSWLGVNLGQADNGEGSFLADINNDGRLDVVENGYWLEQPADAATGTWTRRNFASWNMECAVEAADINRDGRLDVVLAPAYLLFRMSWFEAPADPRQGNWTEHQLGSVGYVHRLHVGDMDGDGYKDVAFAEQQQTSTRRVGYFRNADGAGGSWSLNVISTLGSHNIVIGDVGADGDLDIFGANWGTDGGVDQRPRLWAQTASVTPQPPAAPGSTTAAAGDARATVTWASVSGATQYHLYYAVGTTVTKSNGTRIANVTSPYAVAGLSNGTTYAFAVAAANSAGESSLGPVATATPAAAPPPPPPPPQPPAAPGSTSAVPGDARVTVSWSGVSGATQYNLYYAQGMTVSKSTGTRISGVTAPFAVTGLTNGKNYAFAVSAANSAGESALGPVAVAKPAASASQGPPPPASTSATAGDSYARISWSSVAGATGYNLYYARGTTVTKQNSTQIRGVMSAFTVSELANGATYAFAIAAYNSTGESALGPTALVVPGQ